MKTRKIPMRMCLGCQQMLPKKELIRIVKTPEGIVEIDPTGKKNGRGAYICSRVDCLQNASKTYRFQKALGIDISPEIFKDLKEKLIT
ncbi:MAG: YlxR family protein [Desulfitobacteriaceae bacterium]|nr:YlxR family protein [Desulfitobacteriaceae bacterium]MDD4345591.1 YlxR family protein [Desulfitobacteriaceae bacterium]MDD4401525.1 YlxR family protein [Desulfitobacteriaceae bacterium]